MHSQVRWFFSCSICEKDNAHPEYVSASQHIDHVKLHDSWLAFRSRLRRYDAFYSFPSLYLSINFNAVTQADQIRLYSICRHLASP